MVCTQGGVIHSDVFVSEILHKFMYNPDPKGNLVLPHAFGILVICNICKVITLGKTIVHKDITNFDI